jgi:DNA-binding transcriptional LysR family regulator
VVIHLLENTADHLLDLLRRDELDCAFASVEPDRLGDEFAATKLFEEELVVVVATDHRFAGQEHVTFAEIADETLIAYREGSELRRRIEATMAAHDLTPNNAFFCTEMAAVRALASRGLGVAVLPRSIAALHGPEVAVRPVGPGSLTWPVSLVWRAQRRQPPAAKAFLGLALEAARETTGADDHGASRLAAA